MKHCVQCSKPPRRGATRCKECESAHPELVYLEKTYYENLQRDVDFPNNPKVRQRKHSS